MHLPGFASSFALFDWSRRLIHIGAKGKKQVRVGVHHSGMATRTTAALFVCAFSLGAMRARGQGMAPEARATIAIKVSVAPRFERSQDKLAAEFQWKVEPPTPIRYLYIDEPTNPIASADTRSTRLILIVPE